MTDTTTLTEELAKVRTRIDRLVAALNTALGLDDAEHKVTFGYIGNLSAHGPHRDDRSWSVFLPHPGRVGTSHDSIGSVRTDDLDGWLDMAARLAGAVSLARWQAGR